ncbi:MAG TPA: heparan-alpha-glucosaminide N-acetyltransferase domain-containing protein [Thermoanaerobaculia bacterium]|nr:heparan-alpha-glucosaminide N-acetyltransferase domain-containing protein [Thermoanaerobaculia bacterium]
MKRLPSLDIVRGAVMVLMAIDHVRVFAAVPAGGPDPAVFFTRWITHFCAPVFIFLAGTAAYLYGRKVASRAALAKFLLVRGLWLVLLELTILRFAWTFNFDYAHFTFAGVIWVIGWSMVILAALVYLPTAVIAAIGIAIIAGHNALAGLVSESPSPLTKILYAGRNFEAGPLNVVVLYTLIPWVGVMAAGYAFGAIARNRRVALLLGITCIALFVILRATGIYGDPRPWESGAVQFINTAKYPASLQFLLMTLGPMFLALAALGDARPRITRWLEVFGRVPFFYYLLHIPLIHIIAVLVSLVRTPESTGWLIGNFPMLPADVPPGYRWPLWMLYLVWALVVLILYFACRGYARVKAERTARWMKYV